MTTADPLAGIEISGPWRMPLIPLCPVTAAEMAIFCQKCGAGTAEHQVAFQLEGTPFTRKIVTRMLYRCGRCGRIESHHNHSQKTWRSWTGNVPPWRPPEVLAEGRTPDPAMLLPKSTPVTMALALRERFSAEEREQIARIIVSE